MLAFPQQRKKRAAPAAPAVAPATGATRDRKPNVAIVGQDNAIDALRLWIRAAVAGSTRTSLLHMYGTAMLPRNSAAGQQRRSNLVPRLCVLCGPCGSGKTSVVQHLTRSTPTKWLAADMPNLAQRLREAFFSSTRSLIVVDDWRSITPGAMRGVMDVLREFCQNSGMLDSQEAAAACPCLIITDDMDFRGKSAIKTLAAAAAYTVRLRELTAAQALEALVMHCDAEGLQASHEALVDAATARNVAQGMQTLRMKAINGGSSGSNSSRGIEAAVPSHTPFEAAEGLLQAACVGQHRAATIREALRLKASTDVPFLASLLPLALPGLLSRTVERRAAPCTPARVNLMESLSRACDAAAEADIAVAGHVHGDYIRASLEAFLVHAPLGAIHAADATQAPRVTFSHMHTLAASTTAASRSAKAKADPSQWRNEFKQEDYAAGATPLWSVLRDPHTMFLNATPLTKFLGHKRKPPDASVFLQEPLPADPVPAAKRQRVEQTG
jgi:hypothetical protein